MKTEPRLSAAKESTNGVKESLARCPDCGAFAYSHDRYCACCGASLAGGEPRREHPVSFFCTQCGTEVRNDSGRHAHHIDMRVEVKEERFEGNENAD